MFKLRIVSSSQTDKIQKTLENIAIVLCDTA